MAPRPCLADAVARLRLFSHERRALRQDTGRQEDACLQQLMEVESAEKLQRCPSLGSIPRFYHRRAQPFDDDKSDKSLYLRVLRRARGDYLQRKVLRVPSEEDLHRLLDQLRAYARLPSGCDDVDCEVIDYNAFAAIGRELQHHGEQFGQFFTASVFLKWPRDRNGCIAVMPFFTYVVRMSSIKQCRLKLMEYDMLGCGYLREKDLENYVFELIPCLQQLSSLQEEFYPFYVFNAVRRFFFFLDPKRTGRIHIRDLLASPVLKEMDELRRDADYPVSSSNWFCMENALRVYGTYLELDIDQNGMISQSEVSQYGSGMLSDLFVDRVFEECQIYRDTKTGEREMDYKTFLDLVLAMENKATPQGVRYFWKLLDINHAGYIDRNVIGYFYQSIAHVLTNKSSHSASCEVPSIDDVLCEIFDMVRPSAPGRITCEDLVSSKHAATVISMLCDAQLFWRYDNRDTLLMCGLAHEADDDAVAEAAMATWSSTTP